MGVGGKPGGSGGRQGGGGAESLCARVGLAKKIFYACICKTFGYVEDRDWMLHNNFFDIKLIYKTTSEFIIKLIFC